MKKNILVIIASLIIMILLVLFIYHMDRSDLAASSTAIPAPAAKKPLYWIDAMEPAIHYPGPGKSRMNMDLEPVYAEETSPNPNEQNVVTISPTVINNLGVRTAPVSVGQLARQIETVGYIQPNENNMVHVHNYVDGWVRNLIVKTVDAPIKPGQLLFQLYSPTLVNAQEEYLITLQSGDKSLMDAARKKLLALGVSSQQIQSLTKTRKANQFIDIYAHQGGIVTSLNIREGMHITPETEVMNIVDLATVWMLVEVYESQADWVSAGQTAEAHLTAYPTKVWQGKVDYIYPQVDPTTRTLKVRLVFDNPNIILKPNMYANVTLLATPKQNVISIPSEALIRSGKKDRVIVALGEGRFQVREVKVGISSGNQVEIIAGLKPGENIVTSGEFLLDSEANLKASLQRLDESNTTAPLSQPSQPVPNDIIVGQAVVKAVQPDQHKITLAHEAIPALNWPAMTMDFTVAKNIDLTQIKVGSQIHFNLQKQDDGQMMITQIKNQDNSSGSKE